MNKYNLDEGNDAIKRALLLMKYDMNKTLTENTEKVDEVINEDRAGAAIGGATTGAAIGAGVAGAGLAQAGVGLTSSVVGASGFAGLSSTVGALIPGIAAGTGGAMVAGAAVIGGVAAIALVPLVYWLVTKDTGPANKVKESIQMCSTNASKIVNLKRKMNDGRITQLSDKL